MEYNPFSLKGKTILITGASSGIGQAVAVECSKSGAIVMITARNKERLDETLGLLVGNDHSAIAADLTSRDETSALLNALPGLDGIVNCAGMLKKLPLKFITADALETTMQTNFAAPAMLVQQAVKLKKLNAGSSVVFISSIASHVASYGSIMYMASKGAINAVARGMALELAEKGIRVNVIEPGLVKTKLATGALTQDDLESYEKKYPLGRFGFPEEIAYGIIYLLSDAGKWVTGSTLTIDGGITLR